MNGYPQMTSLSDVVALKRLDMEGIERRRRYFKPMTPKVVPWNINTERPNQYFPNINRTFISDMTHVPGSAQRKLFHPNIVNREATWSPYEPRKLNLYRNFKEITYEAGDEEKPTLEEEEEEESQQPSYSDALRHPEIRIVKPLGLLRREYKHPLSMYEDAMSNLYSRYLKQRSKSWDPLIPVHYNRTLPPPFTPPYIPVQFIDRPGTAGKEWVANRWRMWAGGSASSPSF